MRILLLEDFKGRKAGREWDCPFAALGRQLIEAGTALAVEECDLHMNPVLEAAAESVPVETVEAETTAAEEPAAPPAPQPKRKGKK